MRKDIIRSLPVEGYPWFYLASTDLAAVKERVAELDSIYRQTIQPNLIMRIGQTLEIATFRALQAQTDLHYFGHYLDLDAHDDSTLYRKEEPPSFISGRHIPNDKKLDFIVQHRDAGYAGLEIKNIREWLYPNRYEIRELLFMCCVLDIVPVLIARRIHFSTFSILSRCRVITHETYFQLYPNSAKDLAEKVKNKNLLGYHDVRVGNTPDDRLTRFIGVNLPEVLPKARQYFDAFKDLLSVYGNGSLDYKAFAAEVKRRSRGEWDNSIELLGEEYEEPPDE